MKKSINQKEKKNTMAAIGIGSKAIDDLKWIKDQSHIDMSYYPVDTDGILSIEDIEERIQQFLDLDMEHDIIFIISEMEDPRTRFLTVNLTGMIKSSGCLTIGICGSGYNCDDRLFGNFIRMFKNEADTLFVLNEKNDISFAEGARKIILDIADVCSSQQLIGIDYEDLKQVLKKGDYGYYAVKDGVSTENMIEDLQVITESELMRGKIDKAIVSFEGNVMLDRLIQAVDRFKQRYDVKNCIFALKENENINGLKVSVIGAG